MSTTLDDVKIKLTLDTSEAASRLRQLEAQITGLRGSMPTKAETRERAVDDSPSERDESKRAATSTTAATAAASTSIFSESAKTVMKGVLTAELILLAIQKMPLLLEVLSETILKQFEDYPGYKLFKEKFDQAVAKVDEIQALAFKAVPSVMQTAQMGVGALRLGMGVTPTEMGEMYAFMLQTNMKKYQVEAKVDRTIGKEVINTFIKTTMNSMGR